MAPADPGTADDFATCDIDTPIDLIDLFGNPDVGLWFATDLNNPAISIPIIDPDAFILSDLPGPSMGYRIEHSVLNPSADFCLPVVSSMDITILELVSAGVDADAAFCKGTVINLDDLLSGDASQGGVWESVDNVIFSGSTWDTGPTPLGLGPDFDFFYAVDSPGCPSDTAFFTITITDELFAGVQAAENSVCVGDVVELEIFLDGETPGGDFFLETNLSTPIPNEWLATNNSVFTYIIPGIPGCDSDSTEFNVQVFPRLNTDVILMSESICDSDCTELNINSSEDGTAIILITGDIALNESELLTLPLLAGDNTLTLCQSDSSFGSSGTSTFDVGNSSQVSITINEITSDLIDCQNVTLQQTEFLSINKSFEFTVDTIICENQSIVINGTTFNSTTRIEATSVAGCDSIIDVMIDFFPRAMKDENVTLCDGQSYPINGELLTEEVEDSLIILAGQSAQGCDSLVLLNLSFEDVAIRNFDDSLCADDDRMINGSLYNINNPTDTILLPGAAGGGCDSAIHINLQFSEPLAFQDFMPATCEDIDYDINGEIYNFANPTGTELLLDSNGCDSLEITIAIDELRSDSVDFIRNICEDEEFNVAGEIFNGTTRDTGIVVTTNQFGCDSVITVDINLSSEVEIMFVRELCEDEDFEINGTTYNFTNNKGIETIVTNNSCDTIIDICIIQLPESTGTFTRELCIGSMETFDVNGTEYGIANDSGLETFIGGAANGCDSIVTVTIIPLPNAAAPAPFIIELCENDNSVINYNGTDYSLMNNMGEEIFVAANGCDSIEEVRVIPLPVDEELLNLEFCQDTTLMIGSEVYGPNNTMGVETFTNSVGCDSIVTIQLRFDIPAAVFTSCLDIDGSELTLDNLSGLSLPATLTINGGAPIEITSLPLDLGFFTAGNLNYDIVDINGCMLSESLSISADPQIGVTIVPLLLDDNTFDLSFDSNVAVDQISWTPTDLVDCVDCDQTILSINSDQEVSLTVTTPEGCIYTDNLLLMATASPDSTLRIFIPNAIFTGDNNNDTFYPQTTEPIMIDALNIYDRWGELVFSNEDFLSNDPNNGWNPDLDFRVEQGVYVYVLEYTDPVLGPQLETNDLTVIR